MSANTWFTRQAVKFAMVLAFLVMSPGAIGQIQWIGSPGSDWSNPGSWQGGVVPGPADTAVIAGGTPVVSGAVQVGGLVFQGGYLFGPGSLSILNSGTWTGGDLMTSLTVSGGATLTITGTSTKGIYGSLINAGTILWTSSDIQYSGGSITNAPSGTLICDSTAGPRYVNASSGSFVNHGVLRMLGANGTSFFQDAVGQGFSMSNTGSIVAEAGTCDLSGATPWPGQMSGTFQAAQGALLTLSGTFVSSCNFVGPGAITLSGTFATNITGTAALSLSGTVTAPVTISSSQPVRVGMLAGDFDKTFASPVTWIGGTFSGSGKILVPAGSTMIVNDPTNTNTAQLDGTIEVDGSLVVRSTVLLNAAAITNRASMTVDGNANFQRISTLPCRIRNEGVLTVAAPEFCHFRGGLDSAFFVNTGQINFVSGSLEFSGGSTASAIVVPSAGMLQLTGPFAFPTTDAVLGSGSLYIEPSEYSPPLQTPTLSIAGRVAVPSIEVRGRGCVFAGGVACSTIAYIQPSVNGRIQFDAPASCSGEARFGGNIVFNAPFTPGSILLASQPNFTINQPQHWPGFAFTGTIGGPASVEFTAGTLAWFGTFSGPGDIIIGPAAIAVLDTPSIALGCRFINRGSFEWRRAQISMNAATFQNEGQFTRVNSSSSTDFIGLTGTNAVVNHGTMTLMGGTVSLDRIESAPLSRPSFVNDGTVSILAGSLIVRDGSTSVPFNLTGGLTVGPNFEFLCPTASAPTGTLTFTGTLRNINFPLVANRITIAGGTSVMLQTDQTVPEFSLGAGASLTGPGALTVSRLLSAQDGVFFDTGSDLTLAQGSTLTLGSCTIRRRLVNAGSATVVSGTLTLQGADIVNSGTWSFAPNSPTTTINVQSAAVGGRFVNTGTINKSGSGSTVIAGGVTAVPLDNTGTVAVTAGTLTVGSLVNYEAASNRLTAGMLSVTSPGLLNPTGLDVRTIGPAASVTLAAAGATPAFLTNLSTNEGKLVIGAARTFNATPPGGAFANTGELSLRAGGVFNAPGQFVQTSSGTLRSQIVGPVPNQIGRLTAAGAAMLDGTMIAEFGSGYNGGCNQLFSFLTADSISGSFVDLVLPPNQTRVVRLLVSATTAAMRVTNPADVTSLGGLPGTDGLLTADDVVAYLNAFFAGNLSLADIASLGGSLTSDGQLSADDIVAFLAAFFSGCS